MKKCFLLISFFLICLVSPVFAYSTTSISGDFTSSTYPNYVSDGDMSGVAEIDLGAVNLSDGEGIQVDFTVNRLYGERDFWDLSAVKALWVALDINDSSTHAYNRFYIGHEDGLFWDTMEVRVGTNQIRPYDDWFSGAGSTITNITDQHFSLQLIRLGDTVCSVYLIQLNSEIVDIRNVHDVTYSRIVWNQTFNVGSSFWSDTNARVWVAPVGVGYASLTIDSIQVDVALTPYTRFDYTTNAPADFWSMIGSLWGFITQLTSVVYSILVGMMPLLGTIFGFYLLDALITSIHRNEFAPLGAVFTRIYEMLLGAWEAILGFLNAVASALPL